MVLARCAYHATPHPEYYGQLTYLPCVQRYKHPMRCHIPLLFVVVIFIESFARVPQHFPLLTNYAFPCHPSVSRGRSCGSNDLHVDPPFLVGSCGQRCLFHEFCWVAVHSVVVVVRDVFFMSFVGWLYILLWLWLLKLARVETLVGLVGFLPGVLVRPPGFRPCCPGLDAGPRATTDNDDTDGHNSSHVASAPIP